MSNNDTQNTFDHSVYLRVLYFILYCSTISTVDAKGRGGGGYYRGGYGGGGSDGQRYESWGEYLKQNQFVAIMLILLVIIFVGIPLIYGCWGFWEPFFSFYCYQNVTADGYDYQTNKYNPEYEWKIPVISQAEKEGSDVEQIIQIDELPKRQTAESTSELENINQKSQEEENEQRDRMKEAELALEGELYHNELEMYL